jgi:hypothetical protein
MCLSGRLLVTGIYVPFRYVVGGRHLCPSGWGLVVLQLCAFLVGVWWLAGMCLSGRGWCLAVICPGRGLVVSSYVPFM